MESLFVESVIQDDIKAAGHGYDELVQGLVSVSASVGAAWNIVSVVNSFNFKWNVPSSLDESQIATRV